MLTLRSEYEFDMYQRLREVWSSRQSSKPCEEGVDAAWYRLTYPDIGLSLDPAEHYANHGWREGRSPNASFSVEWYRKNYAELPQDVDPYLHHLRDGMRLGRRHAPHDYHRPQSWTCQHGGVDPVFYAKRYNTDPSIDAAEHYATCGWRAGFDPNSEFSTNWYLTSNPDIVAAGINPHHHYLVSGRFEGREPKPTLLETVRFHEWWSHKFSSFMAAAYMTALYADLSVFAIWPLLVTMLAALTCVAAYVSIINDLSDREVDRAGLKRNRIEGRTPAAVTVLLAACIAPGLAFAWWWRHDPLVLAFYAGSGLSFTCYSLPPLRLKYRGALGPLADALGAHVFPTLLVCVLVLRWAEAPIDGIWCALAGVWALGYGLRGIFFHQCLDAVADAQAGMRTLATGTNERRILRMAAAVVLPLEMVALTILLYKTDSVVALLVFLACVVIEIARGRKVQPKGTRHPSMFGCYEVELPLALLASSMLTDARVAVVAIAHIGLFFRRRMRQHPIHGLLPSLLSPAVDLSSRSSRPRSQSSRS